MMRVFLIAAIQCGFLLASICPSARADTAMCASVGQSMISFQTGVNGAVIAAAKAGIAADTLPGTRARRNANFRVVEQQAAEVEKSAGIAFSGLGPLVSATFGDPGVQQATTVVTTEGRAELQAAMSFSRFALLYERGINHRNIVAARTAFAAAMQSLAPVITTSDVRGSIGGANFQATAVTTTHERPIIRSIPPDATLEQMGASLAMYGPQLEMLPYTFNPLIDRWTDACRAAHQLPPASGLSNEIEMARAALAKGVPADAVLKLFMQRTNLSESEARKALGLSNPPAPSSTP